MNFFNTNLAAKVEEKPIKNFRSFFIEKNVP